MALRMVKVEQGELKGVPCGNPSYTVFKGVPFAKPPLGELRWREPLPPAAWDGVRVCDTFAPIAVQSGIWDFKFFQKEFYPVEMPMSEDCLYLNVWTPAATGAEKLPVMVWIHGGGYGGGYSYEMEFDGESFCKRGVILVTVAYRLGALGFFAHPALSAESPHEVSGNYGLLDQLAALRWVHQNISGFGGDPENVTIFGQSAGGGSVAGLLASPLSKGLIHKAIVQSAGGINTIEGRHMLRDAERCGARATGFLGKSIAELREMPAEQAMQAVVSALAEDQTTPQIHQLSPNVDGYVLKCPPGDAIYAGDIPDIPYMTGSVQDDGCIFTGFAPVRTKEEFRKSLGAQFGQAAEKCFELFHVKDDKDVEAAQKLRVEKSSRLSPLSWAMAQVKNRKKPLFTYYFNRDIPGEDHPGAFHSSELWYVFGTLGRCWRPMEPVDYRISGVMADYWANFAKAGDPNAKGAPEWCPYRTEAPCTLVINEQQIGMVSLESDRLLYDMENLLEESAAAKS